MLTIFAVVVGYVLGSISNKEFRDFLRKEFGRPVDGKFELNWLLHRVFGILSKDAGDRWYEARTHLHEGVLVSLLSVFNLIWLVRVDLIDENFENGCCRTFKFHGFQDLDTVLTKLNEHINAFVKEHNEEHPDNKMGYYQTFVAGSNVIADSINGMFRK